MEQRRRDLLYAGSKKGSGSIAEAMKSYSKEPRINDGVNRYHNVRVKPKTSGPYYSNTEIEIPITSDNFSVTEFENSYLHLECTVSISVENVPEISGTTDFDNMLKNHQYVFFGLKSSNHIFRNYHFLFHDIPVPSTRQANAIYENFLYSNFKAKGEIANKKWVFSPYSEVEKQDNSICGTYIPLADLQESSLTVKLDIIVPITEILCMEAFDEYPNKIFGELKFAFNTTYEGFVYTEVNPIESIKNAIVRGDISATTETAADLNLSEILAADAKTFPYTHAFQQQGIKTQMSFITGTSDDNLSFTTGDVKLTCTDITTNNVWCDIRGYEATSATIAELRKYFTTHPYTICAQRVERYSFHSAPDSNGGIQTDVNLRMRRVTDVNVLMPTNALQRTVYCNPALENFQLLIGNVRYPDQLVDTTSAEFFESQIQSTDFDSFFEATDSFEHSLTDCRTSEDGFRNPVTDDTSFCPIFSLERANAGELIFDGRNDYEVKVEITGRPKYTSYNIYPKSDEATSAPPPALCCCSDTYWIFRLVDGGIPNCQYVVEYDYDQAYANPNIEAIKAA